MKLNPSLLDDSQRHFISENLESMPFVEWDRYIYSEIDSVSFYGWIKRSKDSYKDFVVVILDLMRLELVYWCTSSAKHSKEIAEILDSRHNVCEKVPKWMK